MKKLFILFTCFLSFPAFAADYTWSAPNTGPKPSAQAAATSWWAGMGYSTSTACVMLGPTLKDATHWNIGRKCTSSTGTVTYDNPAQSVVTRSGSTCPAGTELNAEGSKCDPPPPPPPEDDCKAGPAFSATYYQTPTCKADGKPCLPLPSAFNTCSIEIEAVSHCKKAVSPALDAGKEYCTFRVRQTGGKTGGGGGTGDGRRPSSATGGGDSAPDSRVQAPELPPDSSTGKCPLGTVAAGLDTRGVQICIGRGTDPENAPPPVTKTEKPAVTVSNTDGSQTTTKTTTTNNRDGSTTTTEEITTTASDGSVTRSHNSNTSNTPTGDLGKAESEDKSDLCKQNPSLTICKHSSVFGSCGDIGCDGDAIQCATLRAAAAMECKQRKDEQDLLASPLHALGSAITSGLDPLKETLPGPKNATLISAPAVLDQTGWLGAGQFFADTTFTVQGHTIEISWGPAAEVLSWLRYALMAAASLVSFRILRDAILT